MRAYKDLREFQAKKQSALDDKNNKENIKNMKKDQKEDAERRYQEA